MSIGASFVYAITANGGTSFFETISSIKKSKSAGPSISTSEGFTSSKNCLRKYAPAGEKCLIPKVFMAAS